MKMLTIVNDPANKPCEKQHQHFQSVLCDCTNTLSATNVYAKCHAIVTLNSLSRKALSERNLIPACCLFRRDRTI